MGTTRQSPTEPTSRWIWPFELLERIGEGGMGVVYRARYVVNNREVAVKMLPDDVTSPTVLARFERELEVLKTLKHPNIVLSFGGACEDKQKFYAMELVEGGSLEDQLRARGKLSWETVVAYGKQMCAALEYLHDNGVIHRDVKPANFLIGKQGQLKLSDFGLASVIAARKITSAGKTAGTLLYMAPEQIRGGDIDARTDLYALGCVFYELLTGDPPFLGNTPATTMHMHCKSPIPRVGQVVLDCPVALDDLITRLMAKEPSDRPASAVEVNRELAGIRQEVTVVSRQRDIDRVEARPPKSVKLKATDDAIRTSGGMSFWPFAIALLIIAGLFTWNMQLRKAQRVAERSQELWWALIGDEEPAVKTKTIQALGKLGVADDKTVQLLAQETASEDFEIRQKAVEALGELGEGAKSQSTLLLRIARTDVQPSVRAAADTALKQFDKPAERGIGGLVVMLLVFSTLAAAGLWFWKAAQPMLNDPVAPSKAG